MLATRLDPDYGVVGGTQLRLGDEALQAAVRRWGVWKSEAAGKLGLESSVDPFLLLQGLLLRALRRMGWGAAGLLQPRCRLHPTPYLALVSLAR